VRGWRTGRDLIVDFTRTAPPTISRSSAQRRANSKARVASAYTLPQRRNELLASRSCAIGRLLRSEDITQRTCQWSWQSDHSVEVGVGEVGVCESGVVRLALNESGAVEVGAVEVGGRSG